MSLATKSVVLALASFAIFTQACTLASPTHITEQPAADSKGDDDDDSSSSSSSTSSTSSASTAAGSCANPTFTKPDLSTLTACGSGKGHCYGATKTPGGSQAFGQDSCSSDQLCVPDEVINANGSKLASCTVSLLSKPGACIDMDLMPQAKAQGGSSLKQDDCAAGLTCMPCVNPLDGSDTGLCGPIGVTSTDCTSGSSAGGGTTTTAPAAAGCCTTNGVSNGQCIPSSAVPSDASSMTTQDSCATGSVCAPKAMVTGQPKTCDGGFLALGGPSVCIDKCFASGIEGSLENLTLDQDACGSTELCVPCNMIKLAAGSTPVPGCGN